jgi:hypothetical protein
MGRVVHRAKCPWDELFMGRVIHGARCLWGEMLWGEMSWGKFRMGRVVHRASFDGASCPWGEFRCELSENRMKGREEGGWE